METKTTKKSPSYAKGKWKLEEKKDFYPKLIFGTRASAQIISVHMSDAEAKATANLVVASPDMYEALRKVKIMLEMWEKRDQKSFNKYCHIDAHIETDEAIAKAEGK